MPNFRQRLLSPDEGPLDKVKLTIFPTQTMHKGLMIEGRTSCVLDQSGGGIATSLAVHIFSQPAEKTGEVPIGKGLFDSIEFFDRLGKQLRGEDVAERIGREIADLASRPMTVLEAAEGVVRRADA